MLGSIPVRRWLIPALAGLLFLSGAAALIYQVLWLRLLGLVFGVTVHAASTVLASFMAGLALGSFAGGRLADRLRAPLLWLAMAELAIGASAVMTPTALQSLERAYIWLQPLVASAPWRLTAARFLCSFAVLMVPTVLMGATLPLVVRSSLGRVERLGTNLGLLYGSNTAGAIAGTLLAGFYLIGRIGIAATFRAAAALNVAVALAAALTAVALARSHWEADPAPARQNDPVTGDSAPRPDPTDRTRALVLGVFALSGFVSLALEVIWFRVLVLFIPATIYAFTTMLATVLAGIAAGSYLITPVMARRVNWLALLAIIQLATGIVSVLSLSALSASYEAGWRTSGTAQASAVALLPASVLMGMAFPIGLRLTVGGEPGATRSAAERVGLLYSLNVCGGIFGALLAGFALLPLLGSRGSLALVAAINVVSGLLLLVPLRHARPRLVRLAGAASVVLFATAALRMADPFAAVQSRRFRGERLFWREEGVQTTVSVHVRPMGGHVLYLDGLHQANDSPEMVRVHRQIGHLPMVLHPDPRQALVIGLGGGVTAGAVSQHDNVAVDVVELSRAVTRGSDWFRHVNGDVLRRPNVRLRIDDGRNHLLVTPPRYDVITADVIQPFHAGAGNVYSVEYFRLARHALLEDGLMLQWIGHRSEIQYKMIMRTFLSVFPDTTLWIDGTLMVGPKRPLQLSLADFERKLRRPASRAALESLDVTSVEALLTLYTAGPRELRQFVGRGPILTDDRPLVEYHRSLPPDDRPVDLAGLRGDVHRHVSR